MQKKVGILTFHNSVNYGAVLQTFALNRVLAKEGFSVEVIDYVNDKIDNELKSKGHIEEKSIKAIIKSALQKYHGARKLKAFSKFMDDNIDLSRERDIKKSSIKKVADNYDIFVTGSDQVWNLSLTNNDTTYFLDFVPDKALKVAYSVSAGDCFNEDIKSVDSLVKKFNAVSVRETALNSFINENCSVESCVCCDPVLLADVSEFMKVKSRRIMRKKYIFCYLMGNKPGIIEVARNIANEKDLVLIDNKSSVQFFLHSSPEEYLSWIYNAEYVLTDSFHGTAFSVVFHKQFVSDKYDCDGNIKLRISNLLDSLGLKDYFVSINAQNMEIIKDLINKQIDYEKVEEQKKIMSDKSHDWLIDAVEG
ncbi:polysaccharide pyruvyl transferase family protein [Butyrivibrio sp. WCE2006]|uniref:polysaccharide pyruvyl transferase family protein n=1 Tax=Butyrivibrio sp. WCE2006 TaxID=1410611 RepID=UPI0005D2146E|nr:polysaccharide pyruvyl transferase family protein [Butyrivibrio sp. WCE2006]